MDENREDQKSYILVIFKEINSVESEIRLINVSPAQVLAATAMLEVKAKNAFIQQENERATREAEMNIEIPAKGIILPGH